MNHRSPSSVRACVAAIIAAAVSASYPRPSNAGPAGGTVVSGQGSISTQANTTTISQQSQNLSLNWQQFNIASNETVQFVQPSSSAIALNRVVGSDPSQIFGRLNANGRVFLVNPNGVLFAPGSQVNTAGLVASTLNISDSDFLAGRYRFASAEDAPASVVNQGTITATSGGSIALLGGKVSNQGTLRAELGTVAMAAGRGVTLDFSGTQLMNVQIDESALGALAENHQLIQADGGTVLMTAAARDALLETVVNNTGVIEARTLQNKGGVIKLLGSFDGGTVKVDGTLDASAPNGGNGGEIDTSGALVKVADTVHVTTRASQGATGNWLIDPPDFIIAPSGGDISGATLAANLQNSNVTIESSQGTVVPNGSGDIVVNDAVIWETGTSLTLNALGSVVVNERVGSLQGVNFGNTVTLRADAACFAVGAGCGTVSFGPDGILVATNVNVYYAPVGAGNLADANGNGPTYAAAVDFQQYAAGNVTVRMLVNDVYQLQAMNTNLAGQYLLTRDIDATATGSWNGGEGFTPIAGHGNISFDGLFDGAGHTISGLTINRPSEWQGTGLFGYVGPSGAVRNVGLNGGFILGDSNVGGIAGTSRGTLSNVWAFGDLSVNYADPTAVVAGSVNALVGNGAFEDGVINARYDIDGVLLNGQRRVGPGGLFEAQFQDWLSHGHALDIANYSASLGFDVASSSFVINDAQGLRDLLGFADVPGYRFKLGADIDLTHYQGLYIPKFAGTEFDGAGHTISGLYLQRPNDGAYLGLFGVVGGSSWVKNLTLEDVFVLGAYSVGGIAGQNMGLISDSSVSGYVAGAEQVGGVAGWNSSIIEDVHSSADLFGEVYVGGLAGMNDRFIRKSWATGRVTGNQSAGGLVGWNYGELENVYASGQVIGGNENGFGGLVGVNAGSVHNAYALGRVSGAGEIGGLVGRNEAAGTVDAAWSSGTVWDGIDSGGLVGANFGTVSNSYWDVETSTQATSAAGTGLTTAQMMQESTFAGLDFSTDWFLIEGNTRPFLSTEWSATITNAHQLQLAARYDWDYTLANDIDLTLLANASEMWNTSTGFVPLGDESNPFYGTLRGNGHSISNLRIDRPDTDSVGLFGMTGGTVSDLALVQASVLGRYHVGVLAGVNNGNISGVSVTNSGATAVYDYVGGLAGRNNGNIENSSVSAVNVNGSLGVGGLVGVESGWVWNSHYDIDNALINGARHVGVGGLYGGQFLDWLDNGLALDIGDYSASLSFDAASDSYVIAGVQGLKDLLGFADVAAYKFRLGADIDLSSDAGLYIPSFTAARFDGAGHTISGLFLEEYSNMSIGMFGKVGSDSTITGVTLDGVNVAGYLYVGGLVGWNEGEVTNSRVSGFVYGTQGTGGLAGLNLGALSGVSSSAVVVGDSIVGGLVAVNAGTLDNAYATGDVVGNWAVGGLAGLNQGIGIHDAYATGRVEGDQHVAGLVGFNAGFVERTYSTGFVSGNLQVGGLVGSSAPNAVTASFWDVESSGQADLHDDRGVGVGSAQMKQAGTFSDWGSAVSSVGGSSATWRIYEGQTGPLLRSFMKDVTLGLENVSSTYDGTAQNFAVNFDMGPGVDASLIFAADASYRNAGRYDLGARLYSGQEGYDITYMGGELEMARADLTLSSSNVTKTYDGTTSAAGSVVVRAGRLFGTDTMSGGAVVFADKNAGANKVVTASGATINDGNGGNNYNVIYADNTTSTIERKNLTVTAGNATRQAGTGNPVFDLTYSGFVNGEGPANLTTLPTASTRANAASLAGNYSIDVAGAVGQNYSYTYVPGTLTVFGNPRQVPAGTMAYVGDFDSELFREDASDGPAPARPAASEDLLSIEGAGIRLPEGVSF